MRLILFYSLLVSAMILAGALAMQYIAGYPPCKLCLLQRYPHIGIIGLSFLGLFAGKRFFTVCVFLLYVTAAGLAFFHVGVEQHWWTWESSCTSDSIDLENLPAAPVTKCDEIIAQVLGLSLAAWNAIICIIMVILTGLSWLRSGKQSITETEAEDVIHL